MDAFRRYFVVLILLVLVGCSLPVSTGAPSPTTVTLSPTPSSLASPSNVPTLLATPTEILPTATKVAEPTATPTPTTRATLEPEAAKTTVWDLLDTNGSCQLPCFWGLAPGHTGQQATYDFISQFGSAFTQHSYVRRPEYGQNGGFVLIHRDNGVLVRVGFSYYLEKGSGQIEQLVMQADSLHETGEDPNWKGSQLSMSYGDPVFAQTLQYYSLAHILTSYGLPAKVLVGTFPNDPSEPASIFHPFSIVLMYADQGFMAEYVSPREIEGDNYVGCPTRSSILVTTWKSVSGPSFEDVLKRAQGVVNDLNIGYFKAVDKATSMTLGDFYKTFASPTNTKCVVTPETIWPQP